MMHALIIGANRTAADAAIDALWSDGFQSIFHVDTVADAFPLLVGWHPAIILALPDAVRGASARELGHLSQIGSAPIVVARQDVRQSLACLGPCNQVSEMSLAA